VAQKAATWHSTRAFPVYPKKAETLPRITLILHRLNKFLDFKSVMGLSRRAIYGDNETFGPGLSLV